MNALDSFKALENQELISLVGTRIMGWDRHRDGVFGQSRFFTNRNVPQPENWDPLESWDYAMDVVRQMNELGWAAELIQSRHDQTWAPRFRKDDMTAFGLVHEDGIADGKKAICIAALLALSQ